MKKTITFIFVIFALLSVPVQAQFSSSEYIQQVTSSFHNKNNSTRISQSSRIIQELCKNIYDDKVQNFIYDPKQSLFVNVLCNSFPGQTTITPDDSILSMLKRKNIQDMDILCVAGQFSINNGFCYPRNFDNSTDYNGMFLQIIKYTQNDRSNIGLARAYGLQNTQSSQSNSDLANTYLRNYYNISGKTPEARDYPKTHKQLIQYIKKSEKLLSNTYFLNNKEIVNKESDIKSTYKIWHGAFFTSTSEQDIIIHALYNELFFYNLFSQIYNQYSSYFWKDSRATMPAGLKDIASLQERLTYNQDIGKGQRSRIQKTTQQAIKEINNLQSGFPLHIGMLAYQEGLLKLRSNLSKIYTPLHQLHYKLENVQSKN